VIQLRAFIYARTSDDRLQNARSIDDQLILSRDYCARKGYDVVATFADRGRSGASIFARHDYKRMVAAALAGECDVIVAEDLDRLSRNQADIAWLYQRTTFANVLIDTFVDGVVNEMHIGLRGTYNAMTLKSIAQKVHRGMAGVVRDGRHAGGRPYGYRPIAGRPGEMTIMPEEAEIVRRIFRNAADGTISRDIAGQLNAEGIAPPRRGYWRASTINGHRGRGTGILRNELYRGVLIWNRLKMVKNPDTGKRLSRPRPPSEWQRAIVEHLRIVPDELFAQANARRRAVSTPQMRQRPKHIFSGLLRCGVCGGGMSKKDSRNGRPRVQCTRMHESGSCDNRRSYYLDAIERAVLGSLHDQLGTDEAIAYYVDCYSAERRRLVAGGNERRARAAAELADVERKIRRAIAAVIAGRISDGEAEAHLPALRRRRAALTDELAAIDNGGAAIALAPSALAVYRQQQKGLSEGVDVASHTGRAIRSMVEMVTVMPAPTGVAPALTICGDLALIVGLTGGGIDGSGERI